MMTLGLIVALVVCPVGMLTCLALGLCRAAADGDRMAREAARRARRDEMVAAGRLRPRPVRIEVGPADFTRRPGAASTARGTTNDR